MAHNYTVADIGSGAQITSIDNGSYTFNFEEWALFGLVFRVPGQGIESEVCVKPEHFTSVVVDPAPPANTERRTYSAPNNVPGSLTVVVDIVDSAADHLKIIIQSITNSTGRYLRYVYCPTMALLPTQTLEPLKEKMYVPWLGGSIEQQPHLDMGVVIVGQPNADPFDPSVETYDPNQGRNFFGTPLGGAVAFEQGAIVGQFPGLQGAFCMRFYAYWNRDDEVALVSHPGSTGRELWQPYLGAGITHTQFGWVHIPEGNAAVDNTIAAPLEVRLAIVNGAPYGVADYYRGWVETEAPEWLRPKLVNNPANPNYKRQSQRILDAELFVLQQQRTDPTNICNNPFALDDQDISEESMWSWADYMGTTAPMSIVANWYSYHNQFARFPWMTLKPTLIPAVAAGRARDPSLSIGMFTSFGNAHPGLAWYKHNDLGDYAFFGDELATAPYEGTGDVTGTPGMVAIEMNDPARQQIMVDAMNDVLRWGPQGPVGWYLDAYIQSLIHHWVNYNPVSSPEGVYVSQGAYDAVRMIREQNRAHVNGDPEFYISQENFQEQFMAVSDICGVKKLLQGPFGMQTAEHMLAWVWNEYTMLHNLTDNAWRPGAPESEIGNDGSPLAPGVPYIAQLFDYHQGFVPSFNHVPNVPNRPLATGNMPSYTQTFLDWLIESVIKWERNVRIREARRQGKLLNWIPGRFWDGWLNEDGTILGGIGPVIETVYLHPDGTSMFVFISDYDQTNTGTTATAFTMAASRFPLLSGTYDVVEWASNGSTTPLLSSQTGDFSYSSTVPGAGTGSSTKVLEIIQS